MINKLEQQIYAYDKLIEEHVESNSSDKIIARLELKRQKLLQQLKAMKKER